MPYLYFFDFVMELKKLALLN